MATAAQITADQHTAAKRGLAAALTVLPHEDQDEFDILLACLRDEFEPANQHETFLVEQMAQSRWRLSRARRLEIAMFEQMLKGVIPADDDQRIASKLLNGGDRTLANIQRYATATDPISY